MKKINIALGEGCSSQPWNRWIQELIQAGFEISIGTPLAMELLTIYARPGEIVLLDAMLPHLARFIERTHAQCPNACIVVASDPDHLPEKLPPSTWAHYITAPLSPAEFARKIGSIRKSSEALPTA